MTSRDGSRGLVSRLVQRSVDRAMDMQPKRTARIRDELLYAAPGARDTVAQIADAGRRLVEGGLAPRRLGSIALRRSETAVTVTEEGCDLAAIDARSLETAETGPESWWASAIAHGDAVVRCWPPALVAIGREFRPIGSLSREMPKIVGVPEPDAVVLDADGTCLSIAATVGLAIAAVEVAEHAARIESRRKQ